MSRATLSAALNHESARVCSLTQAAERGHEAQALQVLLARYMERLAQVKRSAFRELRGSFGWSFGDLGAEFGLSRSRAKQIVGEAEIEQIAGVEEESA